MKYVIEIPSKADFVTAYYMEDGLPVMYKSDRIDDLEPYTEPDRKDIEDEVWELADYVVRMGSQERNLCFGFNFTTEVTANLTYQEAKSKFEAWLKQNDEIHVGDELKDDGNIRAVVLDIMDEDYVSYEVFTENGIVDEWQKGIVVKTGRHFDEVAELLEKMRGEQE